MITKYVLPYPGQIELDLNQKPWFLVTEVSAKQNNNKNI